MKIFKKKAVRAEPEENTNVSNGEDSLLRACLSDEIITREKAIQISALTGAVDLIANTVANIPIKLYKREDDKTIEIKDDYRTYLLNEDTGDTLDANQMKQAVVRDYFLGKGGYIYVDWDGLKVRSLRYVFNEYIAIVPNVDVIFKDYTILVQGRSFFPYQFVTVLRNTVNGMWGNGITQENSELLKVAYISLLYEKGMVATGGNKKGFVKSQRKLSQTAIDALKKAWRNLYSNTSENVIVLNDGLEFQEASNTSVEMQLNQNKITNDNEIRNILGIPENIESADGDKAFLKYAISNFMGSFTTALNRALLTEKEKGTYYFEADMDNLTKADMDTRFNAYKTATDTGWLQIDEIREKENMKPLGIDMVKMGLQDVLYNPENDKMYIPNMNQSTSLKEEIRADEKNIIINGAVGSGKSTYAKKIKRPTDVVVDYDEFRQILFGKTHGEIPDYDLINRYVKTTYKYLSEKNNKARFILLTREADKKKLDYLAEYLNANVIEMNTTKEQTIKNILNDETRKDKKKFIGLADEFFNYREKEV